MQPLKQNFNAPKTCQKPHPKTPQKPAKNPLKICLGFVGSGGTL